MPRLLDPNETFEVVLSCDKKKPAKTRPTFVFRGCSVREMRQFHKVYAEINKAKTDKDMPFDSIHGLCNVLRDKLVDWRNMNHPVTGEIPFDPAKLDDILDVTDLFELLHRIADQGPDTDEKKNPSSNRTKVRRRVPKVSRRPGKMQRQAKQSKPDQPGLSRL